MKRLLALLPYLTRRPLRLGIGLLCLGMTSLILAWIPRVVRSAVDVLEDVVGGKAETSQLWHLVGIIVALSLVGGLFRFGMRKLLIDLSRLAGQPQMAGRFLEEDASLDAVRRALLAAKAEDEPEIDARQV